MLTFIRTQVHSWRNHSNQIELFINWTIGYDQVWSSNTLKLSQKILINRTQSKFDWVPLGSMVEVGLHTIKNGMLHRKIAHVLLNVSFFWGYLTTDYILGGVVEDQCLVYFLERKYIQKHPGRTILPYHNLSSFQPLICSSSASYHLATFALGHSYTTVTWWARCYFFGHIS